MGSAADREMRERIGAAAANTERWMAENEASGGVCDFCAHAGRDQITYLARPFSYRFEAMSRSLGVAAAEIRYTPEWLACPACADAIDAGDPERLADHVLATYDRERVGPGYPDQRDDTVKLYRSLYAAGVRRLATREERR